MLAAIIVVAVIVIWVYGKYKVAQHREVQKMTDEYFEMRKRLEGDGS